MITRYFARSGWTVPAEHNGRCREPAAQLYFGQTLWRWRRDGDPEGQGTVLEDVESPCPLCLAEEVERRLAREWGLSGERFTRHPTSR